jgi:hypothetical protein
MWRSGHEIFIGFNIIKAICMQKKPQQERSQSHDVDEMNREENEKSPPSSFTGTNTDRYVAGETIANPDEEKAGGKAETRDAEE